MIKLTPQREKFAQELAKGKSQSDAYRVAYPTCIKWPDETIWSKASTLSKDGRVKERVIELQQPALKKLDVSIERILLERARLAFFDPRKLLDKDGKPIPIHDLDDDTAAAIAGMDMMEEYQGSGEDRVFVGYTKKIKLADKNASLTALEKINGMYKDDTKDAAPLAIHIHIG